MRLILSLMLSLLFLAVFICGCAPRFHSFDRIENGEGAYWQHRNSPNGNAVLTGKTLSIDTLLYQRRLNGGIGAQVVGNHQFAVVPTFNKRIYFLDPANGKEITSLVTASAVGSAVAISGSLLYYVEESGSDLLTCFNLVNGKTVWKAPLFDPPAPPIVAGDHLYVVSRNGALIKINRFLGEEVWRYQSGAQIYAAPAVGNDRVYLGTDEGVVICLDKETGDSLWQFAANGSIFATPTVADYLYCGSADGTLYALDKQSGELIWQFHTYGQIHTTPAVCAGELFFGSNDRNLYCVDALTGRLIWSFETNGIVSSSPVVVGDRVVTANAAGSVYVFRHDGSVEQTFKIKGSVTAPVAIINDRLFVVTNKRMLYCFGSRQSIARN